MTEIYRGRVTRVESKGVHVLVSDLHPTSAFLCRWQGVKPSVGASVLVADTSDSAVSPDLTVLGTGGVDDDGIATFASVTASGPSAYVQALATTGSAAMFVRAAAGSGAWIRFRAGASDRWWIGRTATAETGGNAGSNLQIARCDDSGAQVGVALTVWRSSGRVDLGRETVAGDPANAVVTKGFVDAVKADVKSMVGAATSWADFQARVAAW